MRPVKRLAFFAATLTFISAAFAAEEGGVSAKAEALFHLGPLPVTNSILTTWLISIALVLAVRLAIGRKPTLVPSKGQAMVEGILEAIKGIVEPIVGRHAAPAALPFLLCLFVFILVQNWTGLLPGVGSIGLFQHDETGQEIFMPFIRPGSADMNGTVALALISMLVWFYLIMKFAGPKAVLFDLFGNKADRREMPAPLYYFLFLIFFFVGIVEVISICIRPVSLSFRLFGNVFGGENLLHGTGFMFPFYFLELLIGLVQALVFTLLVSVYIGLICNHGDEAHGAETEDHAHAAEAPPAH
jgi:F-type H+-transporting ATPase subunit a